MPTFKMNSEVRKEIGEMTFTRLECKCDRCSYHFQGDQKDFPGPLMIYTLPDGRTLGVGKTLVWCGGCREVGWGERLPNLAELEREVGLMERRDPAVLQELAAQANVHLTLESLLAREVERLKGQIEWRRARISGPRCLSCGSADISALVHTDLPNGEQQWTLSEHPGCGGIITIVSITERGLRVSLGQPISYSPEGQKLRV